MPRASTRVTSPESATCSRTPPSRAAPGRSGRDAITRLLQERVILYDDGTPRTKHVTTNVAIDIDEHAGVAVARSYFTALQALRDIALQPIVSGRYEDRFERHDGEWRF